jgi:hypothetical protein
VRDDGFELDRIEVIRKRWSVEALHCLQRRRGNECDLNAELAALLGAQPRQHILDGIDVGAVWN